MTGGVFQKIENAKRFDGSNSFSSGNRFKRESGGEKNTNDNIFPAILWSIAVGLIAAVALLLIVSAAATLYDIPEMIINYIIICVSVLCLFIVGFNAASRLKKNGLIIGIVTGILYNVILFLVGSFINKNLSLSPEVLANLAVGGAVGALGGVIGINRILNKKRKRK